MIFAKKLIFAPLFLVSFIYYCFLQTEMLKPSGLIPSFSLDNLIPSIIAGLINLAIPSSVALLAALFFVVFFSIAQNLFFAMGLLSLAIVASIIIIDPSISWVFLTVFIIGALLVTFSLDKTLKTYITFEPSKLFSGSVKSFALILILASTISFFFSIKDQFVYEKIMIPDSALDSLVNVSLKFNGQDTNSLNPSPNLNSNLSQITPEQIQLLRKNPEALKQFNINEDTLNLLEKSMREGSTSASSTIGIGAEAMKKQLKTGLQKQLQSFKVLIPFIPYILAAFFFFSFQFALGILSNFVSPFVALIFWILEKTGFVKFTVETREVRKMEV